MKLRQSATLGRGLHWPALIGLVPKTRPVVTVQRVDSVRRAMVDSCGWQQAIEVIARHLRATSKTGKTLQEMYRTGPRRRRDAKRKFGRTRKVGARSLTGDPAVSTACSRI